MALTPLLLILFSEESLELKWFCPVGLRSILPVFVTLILCENDLLVFILIGKYYTD